MVVDDRQLVRYVNPAAEAIFNRNVHEILHKTFDFPMEVGQQEITIRCADGQRLIADMRVVNSKWDGENVRLATIRDITETVMLRERLRKESVTDSLTGLYNRRGLMTLGENQLKLANRLKKRVVCLFADLDKFKLINDMHGHEEGDKVLRDAAQILKQVFRETDLIARVGGDEFAVLALMSGTESPEDLVSRLQETIAQYNANGFRPYPLAMSIGTELSDLETFSSIPKLMTGADKRMYEQKTIKMCTN
ncbi:MAG: hypothetical protein APF81_12060 [Desulfosporosinus sp. BRH_c37]|nr:MAG: hypothetical protein APF81_12060 [Desulfosporosinus sp. BRH_c37]